MIELIITNRIQNAIEVWLKSEESKVTEFSNELRIALNRQIISWKAIHFLSRCLKDSPQLLSKEYPEFPYLFWLLHGSKIFVKNDKKRTEANELLRKERERKSTLYQKALKNALLFKGLHTSTFSKSKKFFPEQNLVFNERTEKMHRETMARFSSVNNQSSKQEDESLHISEDEKRELLSFLKPESSQFDKIICFYLTRNARYAGALGNSNDSIRMTLTDPSLMAVYNGLLTSIVLGIFLYCVMYHYGIPHSIEMRILIVLFACIMLLTIEWFVYIRPVWGLHAS